MNPKAKKIKTAMDALAKAANPIDIYRGIPTVNPVHLICHQSDPQRAEKIKQQAAERRERRAKKRLGKAFTLDLRKAEDGEV